MLAATLSASMLLAQNPKWFKKARKIQLTVIASDTQGSVHQAQGYFVNENGDVVTEYDFLKGAEKATAVDAEGNEYNVKRVKGASSLYNTVKLQTTGEKIKSQPLAQQVAKTDDIVYIMPICSNEKKPVCMIDTIAQVQMFDEEKHPYYTLKHAVEERLAGCPVFNAEGEVLGHIQLPSAKAEAPAYVVGVSFPSQFAMSALDANSSDLNAIGIAKDIPDDESQAASYLFLYSRQPKDIFRQAVNDFVSKFPQSSTGYIQLAELQAGQKEYKAAEETYAKALQMNTGRDEEIHHSFAKLLYQAGLQDTAPSEGWDLEHALKEAEAAYASKPLPLYTALEGLCHYALKHYDVSYDKFMSMAQTNMRSAEYFLYASQCKQMLKAPQTEILALQDSAIACFPKPYPIEAATYFYLRSKTLASLDRNREAITDMNEYEHLLSGNASANFYYEREQLEVKCRMYAAALSDIERAVALDPKEPILRAEEASVNYRVGELEQAILAAREAVRLDDKFPDAYRILGICLNEKGDKTEARKALLRAKELGDNMADAVLEKIK